MNDVASMPAMAVPRTLVMEFRGRAGEYFRIWIVNVMLTIVTLGIYSAWAKVRTKRYFYGNTRLDEASFEYHATPMQILKGRIIAAVAIGAYYGASYWSPIASLVLLGLWLILAPWVINSSLRFNARMSSYRNVRFDFQGGYWRALLVFIVLPMLGSVSFGLLAPVAHRAAGHYLARGFRFGGRPFAAQLPLGRYYWIYLQALGILLVLMAIFAGTMTTLLWGQNMKELATSMVFQLAPLAFTGTIYVLLIPFIRAKVRNVVYGRLELKGGHRFASGLSAWRMVWIVFSNVVAAVVTLGMLLPWAKVRYARYVAEHTAVMPASDLSEFISALPAGQQAFGSELSDIAGVEVGI